MDEFKDWNMDPAEDTGVRAASEEYDRQLTELRRFLQNSSSDGQKTAESGIAQLDALQKALEQKIEEAKEASHKDDIRVYRNVQASMSQELEKQTKEIEGLLFSLREGQNALEEHLKKTDQEIEKLKKAGRVSRFSFIPVIILIIAVLLLVLQVIDFYCIIAVTKTILGV